MLYLIGLGLNEKGYSREAYEILSKADKIFVENYTAEFPYEIRELEKQFKKKNLILVNREFVENGMNKILSQAKKQDIALLIYGSPLIATTHVSLIQEARKEKIKFKIIHNASVLDAIAESGLQIYKFGKIASMPKWEKSFKPESFMDIVKENQEIKAHSLILVDIPLDFKNALKQLEISSRSKKIKLDKIIICQSLGTKESKIFYDKIQNLKNKKAKNPFCIIIPGELHFMEQEFLTNF